MILESIYCAQSGYKDRCTEHRGPRNRNRGHSRSGLRRSIPLSLGGDLSALFFTPKTLTVAFEPIADSQQNTAPEGLDLRGSVLSSKDNLSEFSVQRLGPIRADCGADPAVVAVVKLGIMGLFPLVANLDIKDFLPSQARKP